MDPSDDILRFTAWELAHGRSPYYYGHYWEIKHVGWLFEGAFRSGELSKAFLKKLSDLIDTFSSGYVKLEPADESTFRVKYLTTCWYGLLKGADWQRQIIIVPSRAPITMLDPDKYPAL